MASPVGDVYFQWIKSEREFRLLILLFLKEEERMKLVLLRNNCLKKVVFEFSGRALGQQRCEPFSPNAIIFGSFEKASERYDAYFDKKEDDQALFWLRC